jgi:soluble lytic murein transglycosylase-like protein
MVVTVAGCAATAGGHDSGSAGSPRSTALSARTSTPGGPPGAGWSTDQDPARFAARVRTHAGRAGVSPQLLMAILYNESYKPHDPASERAWQKIKPDAAFGIANMHQATFEETKRGRDFADRDWRELPDDPDLAIAAAAWYLHDLATHLPARTSGSPTTEELLALGYNTGAGNMKAFARGVKPGDMAQSYLELLHKNWAVAAEAIRHPR